MTMQYLYEKLIIFILQGADNWQSGSSREWGVQGVPYPRPRPSLTPPQLPDTGGRGGIAGSCGQVITWAKELAQAPCSRAPTQIDLFYRPQTVVSRLAQTVRGAPPRAAVSLPRNEGIAAASQQPFVLAAACRAAGFKKASTSLLECLVHLVGRMHRWN